MRRLLGKRDYFPGRAVRGWATGQEEGQKCVPWEQVNINVCLSLALACQVCSECMVSLARQEGGEEVRFCVFF